MAKSWARMGREEGADANELAEGMSWVRRRYFDFLVGVAVGLIRGRGALSSVKHNIMLSYKSQKPFKSKHCIAGCPLGFLI